MKFLLFIGFILISVKGFSQVTLSEKNTPFASVIGSIEKQTGYLFIYDEAKLKLGNISAELKNASIDETLIQCFKNLPVSYKIIEKNIVLKPKPEEPATIDTISKAPETFSINGTVTYGSGQTLPGATVFLTNSKKIIGTNANGRFCFDQLQAGTYELVVKMVGYNPYANNITVQKQSVNITIRLTESVTALNEVVIKDKADPNRPKYLKMFIKNFIGESPNASKCKILNPEVIKLHYDKQKGVLEAKSEDFIKIKNLALGYNVSYLLKDFKLDAKNHAFSYQGKPYFEELKDSLNKQKEQWERNRARAYEGSTRHFFKALFNRDINAEGFKVYRLPVNLTNDELMSATLLNPDSLFTVINKNVKLLKLIPANEFANKPTKLYVVYVDEEEPRMFYNSDEHIDLFAKLANKKSQVTHLTPLADGILIDKNGTLNPVNSIMFNGYWAWERIADLMPLDYINKSPRSRSKQDASSLDEIVLTDLK
jgi:hypothetical protein